MGRFSPFIFKSTRQVCFQFHFLDFSSLVLSSPSRHFSLFMFIVKSIFKSEGDCVRYGLGKYSTLIEATSEETCVSCIPGKYLETTGNDEEISFFSSYFQVHFQV